MKFTLSLAALVASFQAISALETVYVTELQTVTFDPNQPAAAKLIPVANSNIPSNTVNEVESETTPEATLAGASTPAASSAAAPSSTGSSGSSSGSSSFASSILDAHNAKRSLHSSPNLVWDDTVAAYAQAYADKYDCSGTLTHSGGQYGENLAVGYSDGASALDAWYNEISGYSYLNPTYDHFTQVVWKSTTKLGCAIKDCSANNWGHYVICSYDPAGNVIGQSAANVLSS